eukprot:jgi/Bigna1/71177/fgenesh1_pg.14_\
MVFLLLLLPPPPLLLLFLFLLLLLIFISCNICNMNLPCGERGARSECCNRAAKSRRPDAKVEESLRRTMRRDKIQAAAIKQQQNSSFCRSLATLLLHTADADDMDLLAPHRVLQRTADCWLKADSKQAGKELEAKAILLNDIIIVATKCPKFLAYVDVCIFAGRNLSQGENGLLASPKTEPPVYGATFFDLMVSGYGKDFPEICIDVRDKHKDRCMGCVRFNLAHFTNPRNNDRDKIYKVQSLRWHSLKREIEPSSRSKIFQMLPPPDSSSMIASSSSSSSSSSLGEVKVKVEMVYVTTCGEAGDSSSNDLEEEEIDDQDDVFSANIYPAPRPESVIVSAMLFVISYVEVLLMKFAEESRKILGYGEARFGRVKHRLECTSSGRVRKTHRRRVSRGGVRRVSLGGGLGGGGGGGGGDEEKIGNDDGEFLAVYLLRDTNPPNNNMLLRIRTSEGRRLHCRGPICTVNDAAALRMLMPFYLFSRSLVARVIDQVTATTGGESNGAGKAKSSSSSQTGDAAVEMDLINKEIQGRISGRLRLVRFPREEARFWRTSIHEHALLDATKASNVRMMQRYLKVLKVDPDTPTTRYKYASPLTISVLSGNVDATHQLLKAKASVNMADRSGLTVLMKAARQRSTTPSLIKLLLMKKADPELEDADGSDSSRREILRVGGRQA